MTVTPQSPQVRAKKAARDEKLQKLRVMMEQSYFEPAAGALSKSSTTGESSSERPPYASYQHDDTATATTATTITTGTDVEQGHIVVIDNEDDTNANSEGSRLLREEIKSLIYNEDAIIPERSGLCGTKRKQKAIGLAVLMVILYWWL